MNLASIMTRITWTNKTYEPSDGRLLPARGSRQRDGNTSGTGPSRQRRSVLVWSGHPRRFM